MMFTQLTQVPIIFFNALFVRLDSFATKTLPQLHPPTH